MSFRPNAPIPAGLVVIACAAGLFGCEFIASVDRALIPGPDAGIAASSSSAGGGAGEGGGSGGTAGQGGVGGESQGGNGGEGGAACGTADDCPGTESDCQLKTCVMGECGTMNVEQGTELPVADQIPGDCKKKVCDGMGSPEDIAEPTDLPDDMNDCTDDVCAGTVPSNPDEAAGTPCAMGGGIKCDGMGACVECLLPIDCDLVTEDCVLNECVPKTCSNNMQDGSETDIDCGGAQCPACADGSDCVLASDCQSGVCSGNPLVCQVPACDDLVENGTETDIDCGGACPADCSAGQGCDVAADCVSGVCTGSTCEPTCVDGQQNGSETDVDCGGTCPNKCGDGLGCGGNADCQSGVCSGSVCQAPSCSDGIQNGNETDVDCGGADCTGCLDDASCLIDADCVTLLCDAGQCGINDCTLALADDQTGNATVTVTFADFAYAPPCLIVDPGTVITFSGDFTSHPLASGKIVAAMKVGQPGNPIPNVTSDADDMFDVAFPASGRFGFYCDNHGISANMKGAVFVP